MDIAKKIRTIPHFPREGIAFHDISNLLKDARAFKHAIKKTASHYRDKKIDLIASVEARGFIFGAALAYELGIGFVPIRKEGRLPFKTIKREYKIEYGGRRIEIHEDSINRGDRVLIADDLLATGGTVKAAIDLVEKLGGEVVGLAFLIVMSSLDGVKKIKDYETFYLIDDKDLKF